MNAESVLLDVIDPALKWLPTIGVRIQPSDEARVELLAISGQEADWTYRQQLGGGPAHGLWQFEGGPLSGLAQVMLRCPMQLRLVCDQLEVPYDRTTVYMGLVTNDRLACTVARLLLWQDPRPLPALGERDAAWSYYVSNWHPGAPRPADWPKNYDTSLELVKAHP